MLAIGCQHAHAQLTQQQMIDLGNLLLKIDQATECLRDLDPELTNVCSSSNSERYTQKAPTLLKRLSQDLLNQCEKIKSLLSNLQPKEDKDASMILANNRKFYQNGDVICPQCSNVFSSFVS